MEGPIQRAAFQYGLRISPDLVQAPDLTQIIENEVGTYPICFVFPDLRRSMIALPWFDGAEGGGMVVGGRDKWRDTFKFGRLMVIT